MRKTLMIAAAVAALAAGTAHADDQTGSADGKLEVKVLATAVLVNGNITKVKSDPLGLTTGAQTEVSNNVVPTVALEYYLTPKLSIETICCFTEHHATGTGALQGAQLINHILILPATLTLKYHLNLGPIRPYVGAGPAVFFFLNEKPGATATSLGVDSVNLSDHLGVAFQGGFDVPLGRKGFGFSFDAKKYIMSTTASFYAGSAEVLATEHKLDPWVLSSGVYFRF